MTSSSMHELLASLLRAQAREQDKVNPAYARVLRARAAGYARVALRTRP